MSETMALWNQVCVTDPATTKHVAQRGGFTAICAQAQIKRATELWGPYGSTWGVRDVEWEYIRDHAGNVVEAAVHGIFWYSHTSPNDGGAFPIGGDMAYKPGNDTRKKLLTDITTKALSKLGFNSDVFEGRFDDNKYVGAEGGNGERPQSGGAREATAAFLDGKPPAHQPPPDATGF